MKLLGITVLVSTQQTNYWADFLHSLDTEKTYDLVRREVLYRILTEFGVPKKLVTLIKMCLNESYCRVRRGKHLSDNFSIQNGLKQGEALSPLLFDFALEYGPREPGGAEIKRNTPTSYFC
jgi:hypothetical protein